MEQFTSIMTRNLFPSINRYIFQVISTLVICTLDEVTNNGNFQFDFILHIIGFNDSGVV